MRIICAALALFFVTISANAEDVPKMALITVTGTHEMDVVPDEIKITVNIDNREKLLQTAKAKTDEQAKMLIALTKSGGIEAKDVVTSYVSVRPVYNYRQNEGRTIEYFQAGQRITVTLHDFSKYDPLMDSLIREGFTNTAVTYDLSNMPEYRKKARVNAILAAQDKAKLLAETIGQRIGKAYVIKEVIPTQYPVFANTPITANSMSAVAGRSGEDTDNSPLSVGNIKISVTVEVSFILE